MLGQQPREALDRGEPDLGLPLRWRALATGNGHGAGLHLVVASDANLQCLHGIDPRPGSRAGIVISKGYHLLITRARPSHPKP